MQDFNYDHIAPYYDQMELDNELNKKLVAGLCQFFRKNHVNKIWDASCGTGAQTLPLAAAGFDIYASDISQSMLQLAINKAKDTAISFHLGDICDHRTTKVDTVISLYNALGHLSPQKLKMALKNVNQHLDDGGFFIGDFDNRAFLETPGVLTEDFFISGEGLLNDKVFKRLTRAQATSKGRYNICDRWFVNNEVFHEASWELQTWTHKELQALALQCGFSIEQTTTRAFEPVIDNFEQQSDSFLIGFKKQ